MPAAHVEIVLSHESYTIEKAATPRDAAAWRRQRRKRRLEQAVAAADDEPSLTWCYVLRITYPYYVSSAESPPERS